MTSLVWLGLGNLALATPLALVAWLSGRFLRRPALTHGLWVLVLLKLVTPPIGFVPVGSFEQSSPIEPMAREQVVASERGEWEQLVVAPELVSPRLPTHDELAAETTPFVTPANEDAIEAATSHNDLAPNNAGEQPNVGDALNPPLGAVKAPGEDDPVPEPTASRFASVIRPWLIPTIGGLWLAGALICWARVLHKSLRFRSLLAEAAAAPETVKRNVARLAAELGVCVPDVAYVPSAVSPLLWVSGRRAVLVLPRALFEQLDPEQQATLLVHELAHWKRGDHWVRRLECLAGALYWWCPLVWWAQAGVRQAEEECCDAWVTATVPGSARVYALALVETVDFLAGARTLLPPLASGLGPFPSLQRRLTMIFRTGTPRRLSLAGLFGLIGLGGLLLTWSPAPMTAAAQEGELPRTNKKAIQIQLPGEAVRTAFQDVEVARPKAKKKVDGPKDGRAGARESLEESRAELDRLRAELRERQAQLDRLQHDLDHKARELQSRIDQAGAAPSQRPGAGAPQSNPTPRLPGGGERIGVGPAPGFPPGARLEGGGGGFGGQLPGPPNAFNQPGNQVERRIDNLERKLDKMLEELSNMRREMANRGGQGGPGGQGGFGGGGFQGGGQGGFGGGGQGGPGGQGGFPGGGGFGGKGPGKKAPQGLDNSGPPQPVQPRDERQSVNPVQPIQPREPLAPVPPLPQTPRRPAAGADERIEPAPVAPAPGRRP